MINSKIFLAPILAMTLLNASENRLDAAGRVDRVELGPGWLDVSAGVKIPAKGWGKTYGFETGKVSREDVNGRSIWQARLGDGAASDVEIVQTAAETSRGMRVEIVASAFKDSDIEGVLYWIDLPADIFAGGTFKAIGRDGFNGPLPPAQFGNPILCSGMMETVRLENADKSIQFAAIFGAPMTATIQDSRKWGKYFSILVYVHSGAMQKGQSAKCAILLSTTGKPEQTPAEFKIDAAAPRYTVRGLGGNYCFNLDTPETKYTLEGLKPQFARTEISLGEWLPQRGLAPNPGGGKLPREFEMMRELARKKIPFIASVWTGAAWMCREVEVQDKEKTEKFTGIKPDAWPDVIDAVGSYLVYAKTNFNAEPDYFSFNETDYGAKIKLTPEEHRDLIKQAGALFEKLGLKTRCLLGDVSNPRMSHDFLKPTLDDPTALNYVGALSFHSWGGATPAQYAAWGDLAEKLKVPLIVAEAGVGSEAWRDKSYRTFDYFVREMAHYQELFQYARPQVVLYWEYTADYSLLLPGTKKDPAPVETERYALQKHWLDFVTPGSEALAVSGTNGYVALTAFRKIEPNDETRYTLNVSNTGWPRKVRIAGIPAEVKRLNVFRTARGDLFKTAEAVTPVDGVIEIELPRESMTTMTTGQ